MALEAGFELAGVARAEPHADYALYESWVDAGMAAGMKYLTDRRRPLRKDPAHLLEGAKTMLCVGKLYNTAGPRSVNEIAADEGWVSRYAWGSRDYHDVLREGLEKVVSAVRERFGDCRARVCVDTAPLLERSYARAAGLGWIGKNTCLINQPQGSWFFLGEALFDFEVDEYNEPPPDRCGSCTRCIEACPTEAIVLLGGQWSLDSRLCISYWTIEAKDEAPEELRQKFGAHIFGCDICQDVCPWNRRAKVTEEAGFQPVRAAMKLHEVEASNLEGTAMARTKGLARNVEMARRNQER